MEATRRILTRLCVFFTLRKNNMAFYKRRSSGVIKCKGCSKEVVAHGSQQKYCTPECRQSYLVEERRRDFKWKSSLSTVSKGAVHELLVCADLLKRNLPTFRSVSPAGLYDLVTIINGKLLTVQVKTATIDKSKIVKCPTIESDADIWVGVYKDKPYYFDKTRQPILL